MCSFWYMHVDVLILDKRRYAFCQLKNSGRLFIIIIMYTVFILSAISPYTTALKVLFDQSDCTGTAPNHK